MSNLMRNLLFLVALCGALGPACPALAQRSAPVRMIRPAAPIEISMPEEPGQDMPGMAPEESDAERIGPDEAARLKAIYDRLQPDEQEQMRLLYEAMEIDLLALFMPTDPAEARRQPLLPKVSRKKFARTPQTVLAARTKLGLEDQDRPDDGATNTQLADWLHLNTMAGEWDALAWFLAERAGDDALSPRPGVRGVHGCAV